MIIPCLLLTITASTLHVQEHIIFNKIQEISTSNAIWKLTLVSDLQPYDDIFEQTLLYIRKINKVTVHTIAAHNKGQPSEFSVHFSVVQNELKFINKTRNEIFKKFIQYQTLGRVKKYNTMRKTRAIIPIIGQIYGTLFGLSTEKDLSDIRRAINELSDNQQNIKHVIEDSLTLINKSYDEIRTNRERINLINKGISDIYTRMNRMANRTLRNYMRLNQFIYYYFQIEALVSNARQLTIELVQYYEDLKGQIDILSLGKITPGVITPDDFKHILLRINENLPKHLLLTMDPMTNLWSFYQIISSRTAIIDNKLVIILEIPLINRLEKLDIYRVTNLPLPISGVKNKKLRESNRNWVANYDLETNIFAIDKARTKYALLSENDILGCHMSKEGFCKFIHPFYPTNVNKYCVIALFLSEEKLIKERCNVKVKMKSILPMADLIRTGLWVITLRKKLTFTITCEGNKTSDYSIKIVQPPLDYINLQVGCVAYSSEIVLPSVDSFSSQEVITPNFNFNMKEQNFSIWNPINEHFRYDNVSWNLSALNDVEEINMEGLINKIKKVKPLHVDKQGSWSVWHTVIITLMIGGIIIIAAYFSIKRIRKKVNSTTMIIKEMIKAASDPTINKTNTINAKTETSISLDKINDSGSGHFNVYPHLPTDTFV